MNKPYTCHNCATEFDAWPDGPKLQFERQGREPPQKVKMKCPGCYDAGCIDLAVRRYTLDISGEEVTLVEPS